MPTYAAIPITKSSIFSLFAHVADLPDGKSSLAWAIFKFAYDDEDEFYFIGGNYTGKPGYPDFSRQIVSKSQLDAWFTYNPKHISRIERPRANGGWFIVTPRKKFMQENEITEITVPLVTGSVMGRVGEAKVEIPGYEVTNLRFSDIYQARFGRHATDYTYKYHALPEPHVMMEAIGVPV